MILRAPLAPRSCLCTRNGTNQGLARSRGTFGVTMLSLGDKRWTKLTGGYQTAFDPRPALRSLASRVNAKKAWHELWEGLHHQGDVGVASYSAVPHLVRIYRQRRVDSWETFGLVAGRRALG
jgi:hypothetical protein